VKQLKGEARGERQGKIEKGVQQARQRSGQGVAGVDPRVPEERLEVNFVAQEDKLQRCTQGPLADWPEVALARAWVVWEVVDALDDREFRGAPPSGVGAVQQWDSDESGIHCICSPPE
ncbi:unnamed protein product, partial [Prorocentrum cordatum]